MKTLECEKGFNPSVDMSLQGKYETLQSILGRYDRVMVAFSGGIDSTLVAKVAWDVLGEKAVAVTADSPSLPRSELNSALEIAREVGIPHRVIQTEEMNDENYLKNPSNRCYFCKKELHGKLKTLAEEEGRTIVDGTNQDDRKDHRPGQKAAQELNVVSPLVEAGLTKTEVRQLAKQLGLSNWDKPAAPCLSSRIAYGIRIDSVKLRQVEEAEQFLKGLNLSNCRVRFHNEIARIEVSPQDFEAVMRAADQIVARLKKIGFHYVALDLEGYRSGSLNVLI